jgi:hypothetical protein
VVFALAEILSLKKFRQADHLNAPSGGIGDALEGLGEILLGLGATRHLDERDAEFFGRQCFRPPEIKYSIREEGFGIQ